MNTMNYKIITAIGLAGSALASLFGGWDKFLQTLLLFMAVDWFTGGILLPAVFGKSPKSEKGTLESRAGWKGLFPKTAGRRIPPVNQSTAIKSSRVCKNLSHPPNRAVRVLPARPMAVIIL